MKKRILVVDEEPSSRMLIYLILERGGFEAITVHTPKIALEILDLFTPDLIITDVMMARMDGFQLCQIIRSRPETREVPLVFLSASGAAERVERGREVGGTDYLTKPILHHDLVAKIRAIIGESSLAPGEDDTPLFLPLAIGQLFWKPAPTILPQLKAIPQDQWAKTLRRILRRKSLKDKGRAVIALAAWQQNKDAPFNASPGQKFFWDRVRYSLISLTITAAEERWEQAASLALMLTQTPRKRTAGLETVLTDPSAMCRQLALLIMLKDRLPTAVASAVRLLTDSVVDVRCAALEILGEMGTGEHIHLLERAFNDPEAKVRNQAAIALARINDENGFLILKTALLEGNPILAASAANGLATLLTDASCDVLIAAADKRTEPPVLGAIARALGKHKNEQSKAVLTRLANHPDSSVSWAAKYPGW